MPVQSNKKIILFAGMMKKNEISNASTKKCVFFFLAVFGYKSYTFIFNLNNYTAPKNLLKNVLSLELVKT